jgi:hypothetical protein
MNEQNFDYLKNQIKYNGFGEELQRELREKMAEGKPDFNIIHHGKFGSDVTEAALQFKKSETNDMYYFNRYLLQLKNEKGDEAFAQSFRAGRDNNITLKEAYNMMNGRAVYKEMTPKEGEKYHAWLQLNFKETETNGDFKVKQMHDNYGYDLKATLAKYPIKEMENPDNALSLMRSLERGNRQLVTLVVDGKEQKLSIEASPQYKSLNMYDKDMNRLKGEQQSALQKQAPGEKMIAGLAEKNVQQQGIGSGVVNKENGNNKKHRAKKEMLNGEIMPKHNHSRKRSKGHSI